MLEEYCRYADAQEAATPQPIRRLLLAAAVNLFNGEPRSKAFRKVIERHRGGNQDASASAAEVLRRAAAELLPATLDAPPGACWDIRERKYIKKPALL